LPYGPRSESAASSQAALRAMFHPELLSSHGLDQPEANKH
jgi:hypothetical protein